MIAAGTASMGRATTPTLGPGAQSRWPRAVARLRLALRSPPAASSSSGRWMGCFQPAPVSAPSSSAVTVAVKEAKRNGPEVEMEPARGGGEDVWSAQAEAEVAQGGVFPEHLVVMVNGLVGRSIRVYCYFFGRPCSRFVQLVGCWFQWLNLIHCFTVRMTGSLRHNSS